MFWFLCGKIGLFSVLLHRKKVVYQSAASCFDFYLILLKRTFFFLFGLGTLFQYHVSENRLFFFFIVKLRFWPFILHKTSVGNKIESFELYVTKSSALVSRWKTRCFKLHSTEDMFWLASNEIGFLEVYIAKKGFLLFVCYNTLHSHKNMFWPVSRKVVLFPALLQREKGFLPVCSKSPCFFLDFTQNNVFSCVWLSDNGFSSFCLDYAVSSIIFLGTTS